MATGEEERMWAAAKREFVADSRDDTADVRDAVADAREQAADLREAELDQRETELDARATELGLGLGDTVPSSEAAHDRSGRGRARQNRAGLLMDRHQVEAERDEATKRRLTDVGPSLLAMAFAEIAQQLYAADTFDDVLTRIADAAVETIIGASLASVTLKDADGYRTAAATDSAATAVDQEQYQADEGPCLDACIVPVVSAPSFPDERWPRLGSRPTQHGVQSALSYHLAASVHGVVQAEGSLNTYGATPDSFDAAAQEIGTILAAHAALAARAVGERTSLEGLGNQLHEALLTRDVIGQAKGILMERLRITPEDAFDVLRHASQRLNVKLRDVARRLTETGEVHAEDTPRHD